MDRSSVETNIQTAVEKLLHHDLYLLTHDVSERAITHKIAEYLQPLFRNSNRNNNYDVDCEFNRQIGDELGDEPKNIFVCRVKYESIFGSLNQELQNVFIESELIERIISPDIIIHERGVNSKNLCIIEVKKVGNNSQWDNLKLEAYTDRSENTLHYQHGFHLILHRDGRFELKLYENGKLIR
jgi:hypothetical protein